ncbi:uncharacterized protein N7515_004783 [Penicillium bovifimosum]|uniref:Integrase catalytic domain-containing protein n=1 Tax=Penicillium bovifimosum TaxID=126998 RepID=A0A9W9H0X8_9EURO|nr:uncharacterized protein N7515_004783 [Penicillium bovifimosum]KAJ5135505.1 hypothetical protein N7515_004783 [Penicillium bovifimosum]
MGESSPPDNETALVSSLTSEARARGINLEPSPPRQPEQNPYAERYGGLISSIARQLTQDAKLPPSLWHEAARATIYIQNRIPHRALGWRSPSEALADYLGDHAPHWLKAKPDLSDLRIYGCKAYVRIHNIPKLSKLAPRAEVGYLVGYDASNIWRIWVPGKKRVIRARDVEFDETQFFTPGGEDSPIRIFDQTDQLISTLDDYVSQRILDDIDIPESEPSDIPAAPPSDDTPGHQAVVWDLTYLCLIIALLRQLIPLLLLLKLIPLLPLLRRTSFLEICLQLLTRAMRLTSFWLTIEPTSTSFTPS